MFCREQVAQLRDVNSEIESLGARLTVIGNGSVKQAAAFAEERDLPFRLLTDPGLRTYKSVGMKRSIASTFRPSLIGHGVRAMKGGHRQAMTVQGDAFQQGGAFVIAEDGRVLFSQKSSTAGDHFAPQDILQALRDG